ncbi:hypothetical protein M426DRAFT_64493 [Hypoxylon sp. CI-4A]|nr:hypothetical protein M426DRAFT_64493 [Hypoxylon sp. CI-4A]
MASLGLSQEEYRAIEQTRLRLMQLSDSIAGLKADVFNSNPLPRLESLQLQSDILQNKIQAILDIISPMAKDFSQIAVHPSTNFPGRTQEMVLLQLLRKKPEPDVATAMDEGKKAHKEFTSEIAPTGTGKTPEEELQEIWNSAREFFEERLMAYVTEEADDPYTEEERERGIQNVRTGLLKSLEDESDEDEEGDDDIMEIERLPPPQAPGLTTKDVEGLPLDDIMRFATRGEFGSRR